MSLNGRTLTAAVVASLAGAIALAGTGWGQHGNGTTCAPCPTGHGWFHWERCPPPYIHHVEGPPNLRYKRVCPRPVCDPCTLPQWGYFQPCWRPWPFPPDYSHCPVPPFAAYVPPADLAAPATAAPPVSEPPMPPLKRDLPMPEKLSTHPSLDPIDF